jgi:cation diffusion facilitator CzcD-associated flavoprotein CzcO
MGSYDTDVRNFALHREDTMEKFDVAVIGAGMAGITAARDLSKKGLSPRTFCR